MFTSRVHPQVYTDARLDWIVSSQGTAELVLIWYRFLICTVHFCWSKGPMSFECICDSTDFFSAALSHIEPAGEWCLVSEEKKIKTNRQDGKTARRQDKNRSNLKQHWQTSAIYRRHVTWLSAVPVKDQCRNPSEQWTSLEDVTTWVYWLCCIVKILSTPCEWNWL